MIEKLLKHGGVLAEQRLTGIKSEIKAALAEELPDDVRIVETSDGIRLEASGLRDRLIENSSLRDVAFLVRGAG